MRQRHIPIFRRRREGKTDYRSRKKIVLSRIPFVAPRISNKNISVQILQATPQGDRVLASAHSKELLKMGWKASLKAVPSSYLVGLLASSRAVRSGIKKAVLYVGVKPFVKSSRIAAVAKGLRDAGLAVSLEETILPPTERIAGDHIAKWAEKIMESKPRSPTYSKILKRGLRPSEFRSHFNEIREVIMKSSGD